MVSKSGSDLIFFSLLPFSKEPILSPRDSRPTRTKGLASRSLIVHDVVLMSQSRSRGFYHRTLNSFTHSDNSHRRLVAFHTVVHVVQVAVDVAQAVVHGAAIHVRSLSQTSHSSCRFVHSPSYIARSQGKEGNLGLCLFGLPTN